MHIPLRFVRTFRRHFEHVLFRFSVDGYTAKLYDLFWRRSLVWRDKVFDWMVVLGIRGFMYKTSSMLTFDCKFWRSPFISVSTFVSWPHIGCITVYLLFGCLGISTNWLQTILRLVNVKHSLGWLFTLIMDSFNSALVVLHRIKQSSWLVLWLPLDCSVHIRNVRYFVLG